MPLYRFDIFQGETAKSSTQALHFADDRAAWKEATGFCGDLSRDIFSDLNANSEWRLEVMGEDGKALFKFRVLTWVASPIPTLAGKAADGAVPLL